MPKQKPPDIPSGLTHAAELAGRGFLEKYEALLREARESVALTILVWGPNPEAGTPAAKKRKEIRDKLKELGHYALFSEDLPDLDQEASEKTKEYAQARAVDLIIILIEGAPGATAELHDFSGDLEIFPKMQVMVPSKYRKGYSAQGAIRDLEDAMGGGCVHWYKDGDLESCKVLSQAVKRAEAMRNLIYRQRQKRSQDVIF